MNATIYSEIQSERIRQDQQWGGPEHDDEHSPDDFFAFIRRQADKESDPRERLVKIAALAVAAVQSIDRQFAQYGCRDEQQ